MPTNEVVELKRSVTGDLFILLAQNNSYWPGPRSLLNGRRRRKSGDVGHRLRAAAANRPPPPGGPERRGSPPAEGRQRPGKGPHILHALKLPPKPESRVSARHVRTKTQPSRTETGLQPPLVCSPAGGRFVQRLKLGAVPAYHRAGRMMKSRRRRAEGHSRGGELRGRRVVSFYLKIIIIKTKCVCLQLFSYDCRLCFSTLLHTR